MTVDQEIQQIEKEIAILPVGNIVYKTIRGWKRMYINYTDETGKRRNKYVKKKDEKTMIRLINRRKFLEAELEQLYKKQISQTNKIDIKKISVDRTLELMRIEKQCILRNEDKNCDRKCESCDLVQETSELLMAYDKVIEIITGLKNLLV